MCTHTHTHTRTHQEALEQGEKRAAGEEDKKRAPGREFDNCVNEHGVAGTTEVKITIKKTRARGISRTDETKCWSSTYKKTNMLEQHLQALVAGSMPVVINR
eukprot:scpid88663/ scgid30723/ 